MGTETATTVVRVVMLGQVDHGKSTLVGRLLLDTGSLAEGKLAEIAEFSRRRGLLEPELAFVLDALRAERDQLITIDAAHAWLRTAGREHVIIDAPGHQEFLKNMITGAASADAALLLVDAGEGVGEQSLRHACILGLLGLEQVVVVVNKMDLVQWREEVFRKIEAELGSALRALGIRHATFLPVSARAGANVVRSAAPEMPWHTGPTVLAALEGFHARPAPAEGPLRFPLQDVYKLDDRRILAGRIESGTLRVGDELVFSPWNKTGFVRTIERFGAPPPREAAAGQSIGITLDAPIFVERGQVASHVTRAPVETDRFDAKVFWLGRAELAPEKDYRLKVATQEVACRIERVRRVIDVTTLRSIDARTVPRHGIAEVAIRTRTPIAVDDFGTVAATGRFVIVDGNDVAGGGTISTEHASDLRPELSGIKSTNVTFSSAGVSRDERARRTGHRGRVVWLTGLPGSGKSTIAGALERALFDAGFLAYRLDGDDLRHGLSKDLGFSSEERAAHVRRTGEVARLLCDAGLIVIVALISPSEADRRGVRARLRQGEFIEVYADCPLAVCEQRDPKGHYRAAREGRIRGFTGVDAPYEPPASPEIELRSAEQSVAECVARITAYLGALEAAEAREGGS